MTTLTKRKDSLSRNLGRSLLKGAAVNFGLQAIGGNLRKDNIWQTLLVGVAGGFGDYLGGNAAMGAILGGGNAIINKSHFVGTTAKYTLCDAAADMVLRVTKAKAEEPEVVDGWTTQKVYKLPYGDLPKYRQRRDYVGCTHTVLRAISDYLGYHNIAEKLKKEEDELPDDKGVDFYELAEAKGFDVFNTANNSIAIGMKLQNNYPVAITYLPWSETKWHTVAINSVEYQVNDKNNHRTRCIVHVMNPKYSNEGILSDSEFNNGTIRYIKGQKK